MWNRCNDTCMGNCKWETVSGCVDDSTINWQAG